MSKTQSKNMSRDRSFALSSDDSFEKNSDDSFEKNSDDSFETYSDDSFDKLHQINPVDVRLSAMNYLARREHSRRELLKKLSRRFDDSNLIETEVDRLTQEGLQSDTRFAQSYARMRAGRGFGPLRIRQEMRERGLSDGEIVDAFAVLEVSWYELASQAYAKKFGRVPGVGENVCTQGAGSGYQAYSKFDLKERARQTRFMQHRGFAREHYQHLFDR